MDPTDNKQNQDSSLLNKPDESEDSGIDLKEPIAWNAPERFKVQRSLGWYVIFAAILIGLMTLAILVFKSWTFVVLLPVMTIALFTLTSRPPQTINYAISHKGVYVADKLYDFSEFRAFGLVHEAGQYSAVLLPVKRFSPGLTIYFSENEGEKIVDMLGARLPMQEIKPDSLEKLIKLIKL